MLSSTGTQVYAIIQKEILANTLPGRLSKQAPRMLIGDAVDAGGIDYERGVSGLPPHSRVVDSCAIVEEIEV